MGEPAVGGASPRHRALALVGATDVAWLVSLPFAHGASRWWPMIVALGAHGWLVVAEGRRPTLGPRAVLAASGLAVLVAVTIAPQGSADVYLYGMYGREVAAHGTSPYLHPPSAVDDSLEAAVSPPWRGWRTMYGPVFTGVSAVGAVGFRSSTLATRLFFQALAGASLLGLVWFLGRRRVGPSALVLVGLSPPLLAVVNGGHNDLLAGAAVVLGVALASDRRPVAGGLALGAAVLVKVLAAPALLGVAVALLFARRRREAASVGITGLATVAGGYLLAGGVAALAPLRQGMGILSRASIWQGFRTEELVSTVPADRLASWALPATAVAGGFLLLRHRRTADPAATAGAALVLVLLLGAYVLPWYSAVALPLAGLGLPRVLRWIVWSQAALMLAAYVTSPGSGTTAVPYADAVVRLTPWALLGLAVVLCTAPLGRVRSSPEPASPQASGAQR